MAREKQVSVRFAATGGDKVKAEMRGIGTSGREALQGLNKDAEAAGTGFDDLSRAAIQARQRLEEISAATARGLQTTAGATTDIQRRINAATGVSGRRPAADILAQGQALDDLRAKYNPMFATIQRYKHEVQAIRAANMAQAISEDEKAAAIGRARQAALADIAAIKGRQTSLQGLSRDTRVSTFHAQNMMFQFQDIGMMMASGQSPFILAAQQGTQVAGVMQQMRDQGQSAWQGIIGGITRMISPMSLLTIGIIGGAAALVQWGISALTAKEEAQKFEEVLGDLQTASRDLKSSLEKFTSPLADLREEFGKNTEQARELYGVMIQLQRLEALDKQAKAAAAIADQFKDLVWLITAATTFGPGWNQDMASHQVRRLAEDFGVTADEAQRLKTALDEINRSATAEERNAAMQRLLDIITSVKDESGQIPEALRPVALEVAKAVKEGLVLSNTFDQVDKATGDAEDGVRGITGELGLAVNRALDLRDALASAASASLSRQDQIAVLRSQIGAAKRGESTAAAGAMAQTARELGRSGATADQIAAQAGLAGNEAAEIERLQSELSKLTRTDSGGGSGRSRSAKAEIDQIAKLTDQLKQQLTVLRETDPVKKRMIELSTQMEGATSAEKRQIFDLVVALDQAKNGWDAVTRSLAEYAEDAKRIGKDVGDTIVGAFGSAEKAVGEFVRTGKLSFTDLVTSLIADLAMLSTRKFILGPIAGALEGALGGGGGGGGFFGKIARAFIPSFDGGTGSTGSGPRSGGLDGRGGFLAMMHPQERVVDEYRGQRAPSYNGPTVINIQTRDAESFRQSRAQIASDLQRGLSAGQRSM